MSSVTNSLNKVFFRQSATPEHTIASQEAGVVYYATVVDGGLLIDDSGDGSLLPGPFATLVPYMDGDRVAFVLRNRRPLILSVEGGFGASDEYAGLASIGEQNSEGVSTVQQLQEEANQRFEDAKDAFDEFVPSVNGEITALRDRAEQVAQEMLAEKDRVNAELGPVKGDLAVLKTETLPALRSDLTASEGKVATLQNTTIPNLQTALSNVEGAAQSADKRSTVSTAAPSATTGFPQNAVWQRINASGAVIGSWRLSGSSWVQMPLDPVVIPNLSAGIITSGVINTNRLNAQEIAAASGQFLSLSAGQITSGTINTDRLNAQEVAGAVGSFLSLNTGQITWDNAAGNNAFIQNLVGDSAFLERLYANQIVVAPTDFAPGPGGYESAYTLGSGASIGTTSKDPTGKYIRIAPASSASISARSIYGPLLPVRPGEKISFEAYANYDGTNPRTNWSTAMYWYEQDGVTAASGGELTFITTEAASGGTTGWSRGVVEVPEGAAFARARFFSAYDTESTGYRGFRNLNVKKQVGSVLIEDGAIVADKLASKLALVTRLIAGPEDGYHTEMNQTGIKFRSKLKGVTDPVEILKINTPGTDSDGIVFGLADPSDLDSLNASINVAGAGSFSDVTSANTVAADNLVVAGRTLDEILWDLPAGVVAQGSLSLPGGRTVTSGRVTFGRISFDAVQGRSYLVTALGPTVKVTDTGTTAAIAIDGDITRRYDYLPPGNNRANAQRVYHHTAADAAVEVEYTLGVSKGSMTINDRYRSLDLVVQDLGPTPEDSATVAGDTGDAPPAPVKKAYTKTYNSSWLRTYKADGSMNTSYNGKAAQGNYGAGELRGVIGFPSMTGDLSGADITKVEAYLYMAHWWFNSGGTATIAMSTHASAPGTLSVGLSGGVATVKTSKPGGAWVTLPSSVWAGLKSGSWRGLALIGTGQAAYGYATSAKLRITYKK